MSTGPYTRKQGEFELRILQDGRLVMIAPDEALLEMAKEFANPGTASEPSLESHHAKTASPERGPTNRP
jgi:hypothetical protein